MVEKFNLPDYSMYNPEGSLLRTIQLQMLEMMEYLDKICRENGIEYILDGGSALGAIRHRGFIPWDDDMDIALLESDYKRLINILGTSKSDKYVLHMQETDFNYINMFPKFRMREGELLGSFPSRGRLYKWKGPGIDIFCLQRNSYLAAKVAKKVHILLLKDTWKIKNELLRKAVTKFLYGCFKLSLLLIKPLNLLRKNDELHYACGQGWANIYYSEKSLKPIIRTAFENLELPVPADYDTYLTNIFGDWRTPPSDSEIKNFGIHSKEILNV